MFYPNIHPQYACVKKFVARTTLTTWTKKIPAINTSTELNKKEAPNANCVSRPSTGGDEENRTPVRKLLTKAFYECSQYFFSPAG